MGVASPMIVLERVGVFAAIGRTFRLLARALLVDRPLHLRRRPPHQHRVADRPVRFARSSPSSSRSASPENTALVVGANGVVVGVSLLVSSVLTYAYLGSTFTFVYIDLRIRHEGFDLDLAEAAEARARR